jgi:hypothetical protein
VGKTALEKNLCRGLVHLSDTGYSLGVTGRDTNKKGTTMTATKTNWSKGDRVQITTTTAGPELLEIVGFRRRPSGTQYVVLADAATATRIRAGECNPRVVVLTGIGGRVREVETQWFHRLAARGLVVAA